MNLSKKGKNYNYSAIFSFTLLFLIILGAIFLRVYQAPLRFGMGNDSARDAYVANYGALTLQLPLTGPFSSLGPFTFGPWYYYQLIVFTKIIGNAFAPWWYMVVMSVAFVIVMYLIGIEIGGPITGLIAALLTSISPLQLSAAKGLTNPNLVSVFAGLALLLFIKILNNKLASYNWYFIFGLILGIGMNIHYQMLGMMALPLTLLVIKKNEWKKILFTGYGFILTWLPLLFFDLNNHWYTIRNLSYYYLHGKELMYFPNSWTIYLKTFWPFFWSYTLGVPASVGILIIILCLLTFTILAVNNKLTKAAIPLLITFILMFIQLRFYWGERLVGYLQYLHPYIFLFTAVLISVTAKINKVVPIILICIIIFVCKNAVLLELKIDPFNVYVRKQADRIASNMNEKISVYTCHLNNYNEVQGVAFALYSKGIVDPHGKSIGFSASRCPYPASDKIDLLSATVPVSVQNQKLFPRILDYDLIDLSEATPDAIYQAGFQPISPEYVYKTTVRWWFTEQP
jgi:hypothetical protein